MEVSSEFHSPSFFGGVDPQNATKEITERTRNKVIQASLGKRTLLRDAKVLLKPVIIKPERRIGKLFQRRNTSIIFVIIRLFVQEHRKKISAFGMGVFVFLERWFGFFDIERRGETAREKGRAERSFLVSDEPHFPTFQKRGKFKRALFVFFASAF